MQKVIINNNPKEDRTTLGSTKGYGKPGTGGTHAGPPPPPQPPKK